MTRIDRLLLDGLRLARSCSLLGYGFGRSWSSGRRRGSWSRSLSRCSDLAAGRSFRHGSGHGARWRRGMNRGLGSLGAMSRERLSGLCCFHARLRCHSRLLGRCSWCGGSLHGSGGLYSGSRLRRSGTFADNYFLLRLCSGRLRSCRCCRRRLGSGGLGRCSGLLCVLYGSLRCGLACRSGHRACVRCHSASGCSPGSRLFRLSDDFRCLSFHHSLFLLGHARRSLSKVYFEPPDTSARRPISEKPPPGSGPQAVKHG